jgi:hypothetical protein
MISIIRVISTTGCTFGSFDCALDDACACCGRGLLIRPVEVAAFLAQGRVREAYDADLSDDALGVETVPSWPIRIEVSPGGIVISPPSERTGKPSGFTDLAGRIELKMAVTREAFAGGGPHDHEAVTLDCNVKRRACLLHGTARHVADDAQSRTNEILRICALSASTGTMSSSKAGVSRLNPDVETFAQVVRDDFHVATQGHLRRQSDEQGIVHCGHHSAGAGRIACTCRGTLHPSCHPENGGDPRAQWLKATMSMA